MGARAAWRAGPEKTGVQLRQYRVGKTRRSPSARHAAKQFKRANRALRTIRHISVDTARHRAQDRRRRQEVESVFAHPPDARRRVRRQLKHQRGKKGLFSARARGRVHRQAKPIKPYEFGDSGLARCTLHRSKGGQFIAHQGRCRAYDGHRPSRPWSRRSRRRSRKPLAHRRRPRLSRPQRLTTSSGLSRSRETPRHRDDRRELRRRSAVKTVIGHAENRYRMGRNYLARSMATPPAPFSPQPASLHQLIEWLALLLSRILAALNAPSSQDCSPKPA